MPNMSYLIWENSAECASYRINIFGFPRAPGLPNAGFLDQRLAIEWLRENIAGFGGKIDFSMGN